jgi:hypothetical protein
MTWKSSGEPTFEPRTPIIFFYCVLVYSVQCIAHTLGQRYDLLHRRDDVWTDTGLAGGIEKRAFSACFEGAHHHRYVLLSIWHDSCVSLLTEEGMSVGKIIWSSLVNLAWRTASLAITNTTLIHPHPSIRKCPTMRGPRMNSRSFGIGSVDYKEEAASC